MQRKGGRIVVEFPWGGEPYVIDVEEYREHPNYQDYLMLVLRGLIHRVRKFGVSAFCCHHIDHLFYLTLNAIECKELGFFLPAVAHHFEHCEYLCWEFLYADCLMECRRVFTEAEKRLVSHMLRRYAERLLKTDIESLQEQIRDIDDVLSVFACLTFFTPPGEREELMEELFRKHTRAWRFLKLVNALKAGEKVDWCRAELVALRKRDPEMYAAVVNTVAGGYRSYLFWDALLKKPAVLVRLGLVPPPSKQVQALLAQLEELGEQGTAEVGFEQWRKPVEAIMHHPLLREWKHAADKKLRAAEDRWKRDLNALLTMIKNIGGIDILEGKLSILCPKWMSDEEFCAEINPFWRRFVAPNDIKKKRLT